MSLCQSGREMLSIPGRSDARDPFKAPRPTLLGIDPHLATHRPLQILGGLSDCDRAVRTTSTPTVGALLRSFIVNVRQLAAAGQLKPKTLVTYETLALPPTARTRVASTIRDVAREHAAIDVFASIRECEIGSLRPHDIEQWMLRVAAEVVERGSSLPTVARGRRRGQVRKPRNGATTANRALVVLGLAIRLAIRRGDLGPQHRVTAAVKRLREEPRSRYLSIDEIVALREALVRVERCRVRKALPSQRDYAYSPTQALLLISLTGMRLNEALRLRVDEVDLRAKVLRLRATKRGYREVALSDAAVLLLSAQLERAENGWVFPSVRGGHIVDVYDVWGTVLEVSGIRAEDVVIHTFRHSLVTWILRQGFDLKVAADIAGHSDLDVTRSIYGRPLATIDAFAAVNDFAGALGLGRTQIASAA